MWIITKGDEKTGEHHKKEWIPACAGMRVGVGMRGKSGQYDVLSLQKTKEKGMAASPLSTILLKFDNCFNPPRREH